MMFMLNIYFISFLFKTVWYKEMFIVICFQFAIRKVQENREGMNLHCTRQLLVYADEVTTLGDKINTTDENTKALIDASEEVNIQYRENKIYVDALHQIQVRITTKR